MKNKIISIIICLIFIATVIPIMKTEDIPPLHEDYTELALNPSYMEVLLVDNPTLNLSFYITLQPNVTIDSVGTDLHFTPGILKCRNIEWGNLFEDNIIQMDGTINNESGTISNMVWGSLIPTNKSGCFANFTFDIVGKGHASIEIDADPGKTNVAFEMNPVPWQITHNATLYSDPFIISNEYPENRSSGLPHNLLMNIDIQHTLGERMGLYWKSNATGTWKTIGIDTNLPNGTYDMSCYGVIESPYNQQLNYSCTDYYVNTFHSNTCPARNLGTITKVEIYTPGFSGNVIPMFDETRIGSTYVVPTSKYADITNDSVAPTEWKWIDVQDLDVHKTSSSPTYVIVTYDLGFGDGVRIDWSVNVTDGELWSNRSYWYVTEMEEPIISNPHPSDSETWLTYYPALYADISDPNGDNMNISFFYQNDTGYWVQIGSTQTGGNDTYSQPTTFAEYNTTVYWRVFAVDDKNHTASRMFRFKFREIQTPPVDFTATTVCDQRINLTWTKPDYVDGTRIQRRPDHFPINIADGIDIYNGTGEQAYDDAVLPGTIYYYTAWSWNNTDKTWSINTTAQEVTAPSTPTNFHAETTSYASINLTWVAGEGSKSTLIRRKMGSYPVDQADGDFVYEGNATSYNDTGLGSNITYYYSIWSHYYSAILQPRFKNEEPYTSYCYASLNGGGWCYQGITVPPGESLYVNKISWHSRGYMVNDHFDSGGGGVYRCTFYIYGEEFGWISLKSYYSIGGWMDITVPNIYLQGGHNYTLGLHGWHMCTPSCAYSPYVTWDTNGEGKLYKVYGHYGYYSCISEQNFNTTEVGPPLVQTNLTSEIENYTARLNAFLVSDGGESTTCGFYWENETGFHNTTIGSYSLQTSYSLDITGLEKGKTYSVYAWANNLYGFVKGTTDYFSTRPYEPTNLSVPFITHDIVNLTWDAGVGADRTSVRVKTGSYPANPLDGDYVDLTPDNWTSAIGLDANVTYFFRIWSYNESNGLYSSDYASINATTLVCPPIVVSLSVTAIGDTAATLNAIVADDGGEQSSCGFRWGSSSGVYTTNITVDNFAKGQTFLTVLGTLSPGNSYYYQSWGKNTVGFYNDAEEMFSTKPVAPSSLTANNYGAKQINLTWSKGLGADKTRIQRKIGSYPASISDGTNIYAGIESFYTNVGLDENTAYYYRAWSLNDSNGLYSTLYVGAYDTTDWLPNITYMSPCSEQNVNRPIEFSASGEDDNPLTYRFYALIGEDGKKLADDCWSGDPEWYSEELALNYGGGSAVYYPYASQAYQWTPYLYFGWSVPVLASGVDVSFVVQGASTGAQTRIQYHDYYNNTWHSITQSGYTSSFSFPSTVVDEVIFQARHISQYSDHVWVDYLNLKHDRVLINETSATSEQVKNYTWVSSTRGLAVYTENYTHWWQFEVSNGIDSVNESCSFATEKMTISSVSPYEGEIVQNIPSHNCSFQINHSGGDAMDAHFYYKNLTSGLYVHGGQYLSVGNGTYLFVYPNSGELGQIYYWQACIWDGFDWHNETFTFNVREPFTPSAPSFSLSNYGTRTINITGVSGDENTDSIMMRFKLGSYPTDRNDGTLLFNDTRISYSHTGRDPNTYYYYRAWAYNQTDNLWGPTTSRNIITLGPQPPSFNLAKYSSTVINITGISKNAYSTTVLIRAKIGSYPTDRTDGLFVCNTTGTTFDHISLSPASYYYYRAWAYDAVDAWWSTNTDKSQKTNGPSAFSSPYPSGIKISGINPQLSINVNEYNDEDAINVYFRSNYTGAWTTIDSKISVTEGTKTYQTTQFYYQDWRYWWSVNTTDGEFWTNQTYTFETGTMPVPTITALTHNTSQVNLSWAKSPGTTHTWIQRKVDEYPTSRTDGTNIYFGTGGTYNDVSLDAGGLYRYRVWSYNSTLSVYSSGSTTAQALTKPFRPTNFTAITLGYRSIGLSWVKGIGSQQTIIRYKPDNYPTSYSDGVLVYNGAGTYFNVTDLMPDDFLAYHYLLPDVDNFGVYVGGGDPFINSCDDNYATKWDLNRSKTGNFSYILGLEPQRVKGFSMLFKDFYDEPGADWNSAITKFEVYNGTWHTDWTGEKHNSGTEQEWWTQESGIVYLNATAIRFTAWTQFITPDIYEVLVGKLGYVHCFRAWGYVTKGGLEQYSDDYAETTNHTKDTPPNTVPEITLNYPTNGSTGIDKNPLLNITIADKEGQLMNISWQYLNGENWTELHKTSLVGNGTHIYSPSVFMGLSTVYCWRVNVSDTADVEYSAIYINYNLSPIWHFTTRDTYIPSEPSSFTATEFGAHKINITWSYGLKSDKIYIERNTTQTWSRGQGIFRYNGTGAFYQDTGLDDNTTYYYQAWGVNSTDETIGTLYASDNATTEFSPNDPPNPPYSPSPVNNIDYMNVYNIWLKCTVSDPNADTMDVHFYWGNGTLIDTIHDVANGSIASLYLPDHWSRKILGYDCYWVTHDTTHTWYAVADDSEYQTQGPTWNFHTNKAWDLDANKRVNVLDLSALVSHYALRVYPPGASSWDINEDTYTNVLDLSALVSHYGQLY